jgi:hypothetical protein
MQTLCNVTDVCNKQYGRVEVDGTLTDVSVRVWCECGLLCALHGIEYIGRVGCMIDDTNDRQADRMMDRLTDCMAGQVLYG